MEIYLQFISKRYSQGCFTIENGWDTIWFNLCGGPSKTDIYRRPISSDHYLSCWLMPVYLLLSNIASNVDMFLRACCA